MSERLDTRAVGLDAGLAFIHWLTGEDNLHYGLWDGLAPVAANLRAAQAAYTQKLFALLPPGRLRILDIGGGAGVTAAKLMALGHEVEIIVPSAFLAERCRANAPGAVVHECRFEAFSSEARFDLCLFSESFQYIPLEVGLAKCAQLLAPGGEVLIGDCFRADAFISRAAHGPKPGGGHRLRAFRALLPTLPFEPLHEEDITTAVSPSIDLEQGFFNVIGHALLRLDAELAAKRPTTRRVLGLVARLALGKRRRAQLLDRLTGTARSAEAFCTYNRYLLVRLRATG